MAVNHWLGKYWKWIALGMILVAFSAVASFLPLVDWIISMSAWMKQLGPFGVVVFALFYALATLFLVPGSVRTIAAGMIFGLALGTLAAWSGALLGASLAFLIGRHLARARIEALTQGNETFLAIDDAIGRHGWKIVGLLRLSPLIPFNLSNYFYGITKVGFLPYLLASAIGMLPGSLLYAYLGAAGQVGLTGGAIQRHPLQYAFFGLGLLITIGVMIWVGRVAKRSLVASGAAKDNDRVQ